MTDNISHFSISLHKIYSIKQNYKYQFYQIISIYVSHFSVNLEEDSGSGFISRPSNCQLFAYADFLGSSLNYFSSFIANVFSLVFAHGYNPKIRYRQEPIILPYN